MKLFDVGCPKCQKIYLDKILSNNEVFICPDCQIECERLFTALNFKGSFVGSHKNEYDKNKRRGEG